MTLDDIAHSILFESAPVEMRAIRLYEFQIALFHPNAFLVLVDKPDLIGGQSKLTERQRQSLARGAKRQLEAARIFVATKFLEKIESELSHEQPGQPISIRTFAEHPIYQSIFDQVIAPSGGWQRLRRTVSAKTFDRRLEEQRQLARTAARVVHVSYDFEKLPYKGRSTGGLDFARKMEITRSGKSEGTIEGRWRKFEPTAIFLYLLLLEKLPFRPANITSKHFLDRLQKQTCDHDGLRLFFRAYQHVCQRLALRGYDKLHELKMELGQDAPPLTGIPFDAAVIAAAPHYKSVT